MRRALLAVLVGVMALAGLPARSDPLPMPEPVTVAVDASTITGEINRNLTGVDWMGGTGTGVNDLHPSIARADIAFQDAAKADGTFDWTWVDSWVREAQASGAEPMMILDYMPAWLALTFPGDPRTPAHLPPSDFDRWEQVVREGVRHFAVDLGVRWFEVWNEPDWVGFWEDTPAAFLEVARRTARAVRAVEAETGLDLIFGGPGCLFPNPECLAPWLAMMRAEGMRPDFVSWHYYGNYPLLGPDGAEPSTPPEMYAAMGHRNPAGGVALFPAGIEAARGITEAALAGTGWAAPELILDEWNVSAGGLDLRNDTNEGAAFDAGVLTEFQRHGLDRAAFFISKDPYIWRPEANPDGEEFLGDWGLVSWKGSRKPAWWTFWLWGRMAPNEVAARHTAPAGDGFWAVASRAPATGRVTILVSSYLTTGAHAHDVALRVSGLGAGAYRADLRRLDPDHTSAETVAQVIPVLGPAAELNLPLPANSVLFVELTPAG